MERKGSRLDGAEGLLTEQPEQEGEQTEAQGAAEAREKDAVQMLKEPPRAGPRRTKAMMPRIKTTEPQPRASAAPKWDRLRSLLPHIAERAKQSQKDSSATVLQSVNTTDELISGGFSALILRLRFERGEKGHRRVLVLLHRLRIRVSGSLHPLHGHKAVFRIECEYANGAVRWVAGDGRGRPKSKRLSNGRGADLGAAQLAVRDVFLIDQDFKIERPTRYDRQGLNMFHQLELEEDGEEHEHGHGRDLRRGSADSRKHHYVASIKSRVPKVFSRKHRRGSRVERTDARAVADCASSWTRTEWHTRRTIDGLPGEVPSPPSSSRADTPMLDPSTNTNPPMLGEEQNEQSGGTKTSKKKKSRGNEVSKHTFYIENSQMRLKLFARNKRQMLQWIAPLEKVARECHWTGQNRFGSFAPIRLNVAAQWLVDGRNYFWNLSRAILLAR
ncbi:hypothetical protein CERSUDRAFT_100122, partial [Gelatoporia subvermispora B]